MHRLRLAAVAVTAGLIAASAVGTKAAASTLDAKVSFRASRIQLTGPTAPLNVSKDVATLSATVVDWRNAPVPKTSVTFTVLTGPDRYSESVTTNASGVAVTGKGIKNSSKPGVDVVQATFSDGLQIHKSERVFVVWHSGAPARSIPSDAQITVGPSCFQPAASVQITSNAFRSAKVLSKTPPLPTSENGTITVQGQEFDPFSLVLITFDAGPGGTPQNFTVVTDGFGAFKQDVVVKEPTEGVHLVRADDFRQREADTTYTVPCFMPSLALYPPIGPPGFVAEAVGTGFPPLSTVTLLNWMAPSLLSPAPKVTVKTDQNGAFESPVLVLYHDMLGPRLLQANFPNPFGANAGSPIQATAPFLVTPGQTQPPDFVLRR